MDKNSCSFLLEISGQILCNIITDGLNVHFWQQKLCEQRKLQKARWSFLNLYPMVLQAMGLIKRHWMPNPQFSEQIEDLYQNLGS